ncbi:MAG: glycosyltransferase family 9 protein, partial [Woeseiaceae bacterium]|nr:glycosyltransferase family 9 protein [Woeseiaceae bacterium]
SAIGDTCHALAVARNIADNWPEAKITWVIGKTEATLLGDIPDIEFIIFDKSKGRDAYRELRSAMSGRQFDVALCMHASLRANLICRIIPAPARIGFDFRRARDFQFLFTNKRIPHQAGEHAMEAMMGFARYIGAEPTPPRWDIPLSADAKAFAKQHCAHPTLVISPCSSQRSRNYRNWPVSRFVAAARYAQDTYGCRVVLTGSSSDVEHEYGQSITNQLGPDVVNLIGQTTLKQSLAVFSKADLVLCPDSGPAHMATAVGTPVLGLYATSNPDRTGPYVSRQLTVNRYPDALQKYMKKSVEEVRWGRRVRHPDAMELISIDDVCRKIDAFFGAK